MITIIEGDILEAKEDMICHQVNCRSVMGSGLAKQIRDKYPVVYEKYKRLCDWVKEEYRQGYITIDTPLGMAQFVDVQDGKTIVNLFGQLDYGRDKNRVYTNYEALRNALTEVYLSVTDIADTDDLETSHKGKSVAIPWQLGCGLANGDWEVVYKIIEEVFADYPVTLYKWKG